jgi:hypothetical protein
LVLASVLASVLVLALEEPLSSEQEEQLVVAELQQLELWASMLLLEWWWASTLLVGVHYH